MATFTVYQQAYELVALVSGAAAQTISLTPAPLTLSVVPQAPTVTYTPGLTAVLQLLVSGQVVRNAVGLAPLTASAVWVVSGGTAPYTYGWSFELPSATSAASTSTRVFSAGSGVLQTSRASARVSDAAAVALASVFAVHVRRVRWPNLFDGAYQDGSQRRARVWPT